MAEERRWFYTCLTNGKRKVYLFLISSDKMGDNNLALSTTATNTIQDYKAPLRNTDGVTGIDEQKYENEKFTEYFGYYLEHPELKKPTDMLATYTVSKGYECDPRTKVILEHITGMGEDTFESLMWNMIVIKKINGDSYAEIVREDNNDPTSKLLNIKPLNPNTMTTILDKNGRIIKYEQRIGNNTPKMFKPSRILHLMNDRVADDIHGRSIVECSKWAMDARKEAMNDLRRISHRSTIRIMYLDANNTSKITEVKEQYAEAIKNGELLIIPAKRTEAEIETITLPAIDGFMTWIKYLENVVYQALGVPKVVMGGSEEFTEASSKIALVTFDQTWSKEQRDLESDLWNQVYIKVKFNKPASLMNELISSEEKNTGQTGFQPNDVQINNGKA